MAGTIPLTTKEKPAFRQAAIHGSIALTIVIFTASRYAWDITARVAYWFLSLAGIEASYVDRILTLYVKLLDGTVAGFEILIECSGLLTVSIFAIISTFTIGLLRGSVIMKVIWLFLSVGVGLMWNICRLCLVMIVACQFGLPAFSFVHYIFAPVIDFIWVVSMWALGMSWLRRGGGS